MVLWAAILFLQGAGLVGSMSDIKGYPENITVMFLSPTSVRVSWSTNQVEKVEKYDIAYKPTDSSYRVVAVVAGNSEAVTLRGLRADTQYQLVITAFRDGKKYKSRPIVFRTLEPPKTSPQLDAAVTGSPAPSPSPPQTHIQVRGVEVGIVVLVLIVWAGAIALFFNRWGKIRMLLPYQPDYKEQLKVPGTGVCSSTNVAYAQHNSQHNCSQHLLRLSRHVDSLDSTGVGIQLNPSSRPRVNSAIDVTTYISQEFLRRHGSTSQLCRKVYSADNLFLDTKRSQQDRRVSRAQISEEKNEAFQGSNNNAQENPKEPDPRRESVVDNPSKSTDNALFDAFHTHQEPRCSRRSSESIFNRLPRYHFHHYHCRRNIDHQSKNCEHLEHSPTKEVKTETHHFGLPILSISEPSPPDENDSYVEEYL